MINLTKFVRSIFSVAGCFAVIGCAQIPPYTDAVGENTAKLRLVMEEPIISDLFLRSVDVESCEPKEGFLWLSGGAKRLYIKKVGMLDSKPPQEGILEFVIPAGKAIAAVPVMHVAKLNAGEILLATGIIMQQHIIDMQPGICDSPAFRPEAGAEYEISYKVKPGECITTIYKLDENAGKVLRTDITNQLGISVKYISKTEASCEESNK